MRAPRSKPPASVRSIAIGLLARREYARAELTARLIQRGGIAEEVVQVLDDLERLGYLSDQRYARMLVAQRAGRYGKRAIAHALAQRGVAAAAARDALDGLSANDELAEAVAVLQRRFAEAPGDDRQRARQVRFLMSRGYAMSVALKAVRSASDSRHAQQGESTADA